LENGSGKRGERWMLFHRFYWLPYQVKLKSDKMAELSTLIVALKTFGPGLTESVALP